MTNSENQFLLSAIDTLRTHKNLADRAIVQVANSKMHEPIDDATNSIVIIMKHVAGNLRSRWTEFLTSDGEKDWRNRDSEFVDDFQTRDELMEYWESGWACVFKTIEALTEDDLRKVVFIRGVEHSVPLAISRSVGHTCYHVGQIVLLARHHAGNDWTTLTIPKGEGESEQYNRENWGPKSDCD